MQRRDGWTPLGVIFAPDTSLISPAGQVPSSTRMRWPRRRPTMSRSRETRLVIACATGAMPVSKRQQSRVRAGVIAANVGAGLRFGKAT